MVCLLAGVVLFGGLLLVLGIMLKNSALRYASLAVMLLAVGKVFPVRHRSPARSVSRAVVSRAGADADRAGAISISVFVFTRPRLTAEP